MRTHRLRTTLTALRIDAETLSDPGEAWRIARGLDDLDRAVAHCDAAEVVRERAAFWLALAEEQDRLMHVDVPDAVPPVGAAAEDSAVCMDTLLDNVFIDTAEGTPFTMQLTAAAAGGAVLTVADSGPGFPWAASGQNAAAVSTSEPPVAERGAGTGRHSTGLGVAIARRVAVGSGGMLPLAVSVPGGAAVVVELGPPRDDAGLRPPRRTQWPRGRAGAVLSGGESPDTGR